MQVKRQPLAEKEELNDDFPFSAFRRRVFFVTQTLFAELMAPEVSVMRDVRVQPGLKDI